MLDVWTETYRPKRIADIVGQEHLTSRLQSYVKKKDMPNLLFAGKPGTGKTTAAICLAREMYGTNWKNEWTQLNASDERGIATVREKIKRKAQVAPPSGVGFKIIFLDEADMLTTEAQHALRRTMEDYSHITRFILSCNYSNKIIEPIQSRAAVVRFRPLNQFSIQIHLKYICNAEKLKIDSLVLSEIAALSKGDMRVAVTTLMDMSLTCVEFTVDEVHKRLPTMEITRVKDMLGLAIQGELDSAYKVLDELYWEKGYYGTEIINLIYEFIIKSNMKQENRFKLCYYLAQVDARITDGRNEMLQIQSVLEYIRNLKVNSSSSPLTEDFEPSSSP